MDAKKTIHATLDKLKKALRAAKDFYPVWERFHDEVAMAPVFHTAGVAAKNEQIEVVLAAIAKNVLGGNHKISDIHFTCLPDQHFWHGFCAVGKRVAIFFYFDDIDVGLAGFMKSFEDQDVTLSRFTMIQLAPPARETGRTPN